MPKNIRFRNCRRRIDPHPGFPLSKSGAARYLAIMSTRFLPLLLSVLFLFTGGLVQAATPYRPPNLEKEIFDTKKLKLDKFDRLDLSVERLVLETEFSTLFTERERGIARQRLLSFGHEP